jgi:hypothetical protein
LIWTKKGIMRASGGRTMRRGGNPAKSRWIDKARGGDRWGRHAVALSKSVPVA